MLKQGRRVRVCTFVLGVALSGFSGWANADPPARIARIGYVSGAVSFSPSGESDWARAALNRPLTSGDRLWADARGRAEIQIGGAIVRVNAGTGLSLLNLDDQIAQLQLTQGTLNVRVRRLERNQVFEVDTPNLALIVRQPGEYRIAVDLDGNATTIVVRKGQAEVYGDAASYVVDSRQPYRFIGTDLREYQVVDAPRPDEFDRWASDRDRVYDRSLSARYVSPDVIGYQDLDANGRWRVDATYGNVWVPNRVAAGWAPYRDGHWAWVDPWGWTWIDDAPWGFAVSHYGRWANLQGTWGWVPGPVSSRAYYAPAVVRFVGGDNFQLSVSSGTVAAVAWFALAPREVYQPSYAVSRGYFENINRSNTVVNTTVINNYYNNTNVTNIVYVNRAVPGAVVAVPTTAFVQAQPVSRAALRVVPAMLAQRPVVAAPPVAPVERSVRGAAAPADKPPARAFERPVIAHAAPPAAHVGFAAQQPQLAAKPGIPLDEAVRKLLKPAESVPAPAVKVIAQAQKAPPTVQPPPPAAVARPDAADRKPMERAPVAAPPMPAAPAAPVRGVAPAPAMPSVPTAPPVTQRGAAEPRGTEQRGAESRRPAVIEPTVAAPQPNAQPPAAPVAQPRGDPQLRGRGDQPVQAVPSAPRAIEPKVVPPPVAMPQPVTPPPAAPVAPPRADPQQRGRADQPVQAVPPAPRAIEPKVAPPQAVAPAPVAVPAPQRPARPEAAPKEPPPQRDAAPGAQQRVERPKPAASQPDDKKDNVDERKGGKGRP